MCRILIVEDAICQADALLALIEQHPCAATVQIERCAFSKVHARLGQAPRIDVLFTPVDVADPASSDADEHAGIDLVCRLQAERTLPLVVYCTTREQYTSRVYATEHQYLLLAPYSACEVRNALDKVMGLLGRGCSAPLALRRAGSVHVMDPSEVVYVKSMGRKVLVQHVDGRLLEAYAALSDLEQQLPGNFVRCHKSYLVNMEHVRTAARDGLVLDCGAAVPVSQRQYRRVRDALASFTSL